MPDFRLDGKVALVTGASSGIGARCARALDAAGARVAVVARRKDRLDALAGELHDAVVIAVDLADPTAPVAVVDEVVRATGRLDVLVNAAGITKPKPASRETPADVRELLEVNLLAPILLCQASLPAMRDAGGGSIVNISSIAATHSEPTIPAGTYAASKGALRALTRELAVQWARHGVRVNALAPGWFPTEMTEDLTAAPDRVAAFEARIPLGRLGELHELDGPLLLLASDAGSYLTGQTIVVDGGITGI